MLIAISGKKQSGKDTTGNIIKILLNSPHLSNEGVKTFLRKEVNPDNFYYPNNWEIKKFADKLKDIVCLLIGCTREQLEDEDFKSKELGEEWWYYKVYESQVKGFVLYSYLENKDEYHNVALVKPTPRLMMQLIGTECGRNIIHPKIWINSLFADYKPMDFIRGTVTEASQEKNLVYPNWIITDMRFPNEQGAVDMRDGICIRVNRKKSPERLKFELEEGKPVEHESETALDNALFDYTIDNDGTIDELIDRIRIILTRENLLWSQVKDN